MIGRRLVDIKPAEGRRKFGPPFLPRPRQRERYRWTFPLFAWCCSFRGSDTHDLAARGEGYRASNSPPALDDVNRKADDLFDAGPLFYPEVVMTGTPPRIGYVFNSKQPYEPTLISQPASSGWSWHELSALVYVKRFG